MGYTANEENVISQIHEAQVGAVVQTVIAYRETIAPFSANLVPDREIGEFHTDISGIIDTLNTWHFIGQHPEQLGNVHSLERTLRIQLQKASSSLRHIAEHVAKRLGVDPFEMQKHFFLEVANAALPYDFFIMIDEVEQTCHLFAEVDQFPQSDYS